MCTTNITLPSQPSSIDRTMDFLGHHIITISSTSYHAKVADNVIANKSVSISHQLRHILCLSFTRLYDLTNDLKLASQVATETCASSLNFLSASILQLQAQTFDYILKCLSLALKICISCSLYSHYCNYHKLPGSSLPAHEGQCHSDCRWSHSTPWHQYIEHLHGAGSACCEVRRFQNPFQ